MQAKLILEQLKKQGAKMTSARKALVEVFSRNHLPLTEPELRTKLAVAGVKVNKTTVYRELQYLKEQSLVRQIDFGDGKKRFELAAGEHHHHLVCTNCDLIEDVHVKNDVGQIEKLMLKAKKFRVTHHSLEFFGLCANCQK